MEPKIFNDLVDELLEPNLKSYIQKKNRNLDEYREQSITLVPKAKECDECELVVKNRKVVYYLKHHNTSKSQWWRKCIGCGKKNALLNGLKDV